MPWHTVHIITTLELGGAQRATLDQLRFGRFGRREEDRPCATLLYGESGPLEEEAKKISTLNLIQIPHLQRAVSAYHDSRALLALRRTLQRLRHREQERGPKAGPPSPPRQRLLVHTHSSKAGILGRVAARMANADLVVHTAHGFGHAHHGAPWLRKAFLLGERGVGPLADGYTADSQANIEQGRREGLFGGKPARMIPCGIDVEAIERGAQESAGLKRALEIPEDHQVLLNLSCLKPQKDPLAYVDLARRVLRQRPKTTFLLAGDGSLRSQVEAHARPLGKHFRLLGWRQDVGQLLGISDLLVLTSRWEGLPQAIPQAMAAGVPVVANAVDGTPEAVDPGATGLLYDVGDTHGMSQGLIALLDHKERRRKMGQRARQRVERFSIPTMIAELDRFYAALESALSIPNRIQL